MTHRFNIIEIDNKNEKIPLSEIESSDCLQCKQPFNSSSYIMWTRLNTGKVIWWHINKDPNVTTAPCRYKSDTFVNSDRTKQIKHEYYERNKI